MRCAACCSLADLSRVRRAASRRTLVLLTLALFPSLLQGDALLQQPREITAGQTIEANLPPDAGHAYSFNAALGRFFHIVVQQGFTDLAITVWRPDGTKLVETDGTWHSTEQASFIADVDGTFRIEIRKKLKSPIAQPYSITVGGAESPSELDRARIRAEALSTEAKQSTERTTAAAFRAAIEKHDEALAVWRDLREREREAHTLNALGFIHHALGENDQAMARFELALALRTERNDIGGEAETLGNIAALHSSLGRKRQAIEYYERSLGLRRRAGDTGGQGLVLNNMGVVAGELGEVERSIGSFEQALPLLQLAGDQGTEAGALLNIGAAHGMLGEGQRALDYYARSMPLLRSAGNRRGEARALINIGNMHRSLGSYRDALMYYQRAAPLAEELGDRRTQAAVLTSIGSVHKSLGQFGTALERYGEALPILQAVGDRRGEAQTRLELADTQRRINLLAAARDEYLKALELVRGVGDRRAEGVGLNGLAMTLAASGAASSAEERFLQALALAREVRDRNTEPEILLNLARLHRNQGRLDQARNNLEAALPILESVRSGFLSLDYRASYLASQRQVYEEYIAVLMDSSRNDPANGFDAAAFSASERARARSLLEMLTEAKADIRQGVDAALVQREGQLQQLLNDKAERQVRLLSGAPSATATRESESLAGEIRELLSEYDSVLARIRATSPRYAALTQPRPLTAAEIQQRVLDADTLLLQYALGEDRSYVWAVSPAGLTSHQLPGRREIESAAREFYDLISTPGDATFSSGPAEHKRRVDRAGSHLSRLLLEPLGPALRTRRLLIVSEGALQYVPFAALPAPGTDGRPLVADHEIVTAPSASTIAVVRAETAGRPAPPKLVAVLADPVFAGDDPRVAAARATNGHPAPALPPARGAASAGHRVPPRASEFAEVVRAASDASGTAIDLPRLPFTRREAEAILNLVPPGDGFKALDFDASITTATDPALAQYKILHFATHGFINSSQPELSGLVLSLVDASGKRQRGFLRAHDVYNLALPAELVVLSACRSALGADVRGEGLLGLTRGFMYAGALRVVASLWKVDDEATAELVRRFYTALLKEHLSPVAALRQAQLAMSRTRRWASPRYWAAFVIQGEWR
jgi:CHAT domain-containing protein/Tfp pilus assembly protein PilF